MTLATSALAIQKCKSVQEKHTHVMYIIHARVAYTRDVATLYIHVYTSLSVPLGKVTSTITYNLGQGSSVVPEVLLSSTSVRSDPVMGVRSQACVHKLEQIIWG